MPASLNFLQHSQTLAAGLSRLQPLTDAISARVSSGNRLDRPSADVAATGQAAKLDAQQARLDAVEVNLQSGVSRMQVTSSQINGLNRILTRMSELASLGTNPLQEPEQRALYEGEFTQLQDQLRQVIGGSTAEIGGTAGVSSPTGSFNGTALFGSGPAETLTIGLQTDERLPLPVLNFRAGALGDLVKQDATGAFTLKIGASSPVLADAIEQAANGLATVGAVQSRLEAASRFATTAKTNHEAALSVIRDADVAADTTAIARLQILNESHSAMLAQARDASSKLLPLLSRN